MAERTRYTYKSLPDQALSLFVQSLPAQAGGRPAVLLFHGGGWRKGHPKKLFPLMDALGEMGIVGISAGYRLAEDGPLRNLPLPAIQDARSALRWVRQRSADLGLDPTRIAAGGLSAGAHLALMAALGNGLDEPGEGGQPLSGPDALILVSAPYDLTSFPSVIPTSERERISPLHLLTSHLPPTLALHGQSDPKIPIGQARAFAARAESLGLGPVQLVALSGGKHAMKAFKQDDEEGLAGALTPMAEFLRQLGWC